MIMHSIIYIHISAVYPFELDSSSRKPKDRHAHRPALDLTTLPDLLSFALVITATRNPYTINMGKWLQNDIRETRAGNRKRQIEVVRHPPYHRIENRKLTRSARPSNHTTYSHPN